jgi:hypothetical protein
MEQLIARVCFRESLLTATLRNFARPTLSHHPPGV